LWLQVYFKNPGFNYFISDLFDSKMKSKKSCNLRSEMILAHLVLFLQCVDAECNPEKFEMPLLRADLYPEQFFITLRGNV
jgi:hypothetical protein